jgi:hypothetical protein
MLCTYSVDGVATLTVASPVSCLWLPWGNVRYKWRRVSASVSHRHVLWRPKARVFLMEFCVSVATVGVPILFPGFPKSCIVDVLV